MIGQHRLNWHNGDGITLADLRHLVAQADLVGLADTARVGTRLRFGKAPSGTSAMKTLAVEGPVVREGETRK